MPKKSWKEDLQKKVRLYSLEITAVFVLVVGIVILSLLNLPDFIENYTMDLRFRARGPQKQSPDIVIIEIAKDTLDQLKSRFPIPRRHYGNLISALSRFRPKIIAFDIIFSEPSISTIDFPSFRLYLEKAGKTLDETQLDELYDKYSRSGVLSKLDDEAFRLSMGKAGNVFLPYHFVFDEITFDDKGFFVAQEKENVYPPFEEVIKGTGFINVDRREGTVRKIPLFIKYNDKLYRHLVLNIVMEYLGLDKDDMDIKKGQVRISNKIRIPVDENYQMTVNWAGRWVDSFQHYSFVDVVNSYGQMLKGEKPLIDLNLFKDKICIIGMTETGIGDAKTVPVEDIIPGVGVWLHAINTLLIKEFVTEYPDTLTFLYSLALMLTAILFIKKWQPYVSLPAVAVLVLLYVGVTFYFFNAHALKLSITQPTLYIVLGVFVTLSYNYLKLKSLMDLQLTFEQKLVMTAKTAVPLEKQKIGKYQVLGEIGRGGMAIVFKGKELGTGRIVAIKVINPQYSADPTFKIRFKREAKVMMRIKHPSIIEIYELNKQMGVYYYAMEYFVGKDLSEKFPALRKKGEKEILRVLKQILEGLQSVHEKEIVHRDIKPANILINDA
ncbi:MAG: CHASE2 domain-containing protein, partial [Candidatus Aureabacteria bacterium]|nr:CHASE2 domain-containing protein [Candidatus Auribacterota bacterium]